MSETTPLPDLRALFESIEQQGEREQSPVYLSSSADPTVPDTDPGAPYVRAAAVLNTFDAERLRPWPDAPTPPTSATSGKDPNHPIHRLLGQSVMVLETDQAVGTAEPRVRWCLREPVRRTALAELLAAGRIGDALAANPEMASDERDPVQSVLGRILTGTLDPLSSLRLEELTALEQVHPWVEDLPLSVPPLVEIRRYLARERVLDSFRRLVGRWQDGRFVEHFRGRRAELQQLREYVDVATSESWLESAKRTVGGATRDLLNLLERPPLVIQGPGGVGKSTLIAKFLLQHAEAHEQRAFPFVYIDLDDPDIRMADPATLLAEAADQLAIQYPNAAGALQDLRGRLLAGQPPSAESDSSSPVEVFASIHRRYMETDQPLLFVLDTFEEVQQRSQDFVHGIFVMLDELQAAIPRLRTVLAGRAPIPDSAGFKATHIALHDLDDEAARGFLESQGIVNPALAKDIIGLVGRYPLALKLAVELVQSRGADEIANLTELTGGSGLFGRFLRLWRRSDVTGRLYERLLNHITDLDVRRLAHPGLVLRVITVDIIRHVLAKPCGVRVDNDAAARGLLERFGLQVSLVSSEPGVLRHRSDVRLIMLPLILNDEKTSTQVAEIQTLAVAYYMAREGTAARAEEIYHRLLLGQSPRDVEPRWIDGLTAHLRSSLDELPPRAQAFMAARINAERSEEVWAAADVEDWELYAERRVRDLLSANRAEQAERVLLQRAASPPRGRQLGLGALVHAALGRPEEARRAAEAAMVALEQAKDRPAFLGDLRALVQATGPEHPRGGQAA